MPASPPPAPDRAPTRPAPPPAPAPASPPVPAAAGGASRRTERLLNLLIALLSTRTRLTKDALRGAVPQYAECATDEAFDRMFERDKEELRELGVPVVAAPMSAWFDDELGYAVDREAYALPAVAFTPAELGVLGLASRVWQQASLAGPAARALVKLTAAGVEPDEESFVGLEPRVRTSEPAFDPLYAATRDRAPVTFGYRARSTGTLATRHVQPWQLRSWRGHWYLLGHDTDRGQTRVFRLTRVVGAVRRSGPAGSFTPPDDVDAREMLTRLAPLGPERTAHLELRAGVAASLRTRAGADPVQREVTVSFTDTDELARAVAAAGADALVVGPPDLAEAVARLLSGAAQAHAGPGPGAAARPEGAVPAAGRAAASRPGRARAARPAPPSAADRLARLLAMVPWLLAHPGVDLGVAADHFAITADQLVADLELLFVCGTPGHMPDDLIEASWEGGKVHLGNAEAISRPLRLTMDEALALLAGLRTLADLPAADDQGADALASATAKLSEAAGESVASARALRVDLSPPPAPGAAPDPGALTAARTAVAERRRLRLRYLVPARDEVTEREVDPVRLIALDGHWYLEGWCHRAEGVRRFRLDRVLAATVLDIEGSPPPEAVVGEVGAELFTPAPDDPEVALDLEEGSAWLTEQYPFATVTDLGAGRSRMVLRTADTRWVPRLVLSLGGQAAVVAPQPLREAVHRAALAALARQPA